VTYLDLARSRRSRAGGLREHSHRPALAGLLEHELTGLTIVNEPAQIECGAPDFVILRETIPVGHIEAKDLGLPLAEVAESEQLRRYRAGLPNLILTNYIDFIWFVEGDERRRVTIAKKGKAKTALVRSSEAYPDLDALLAEFAAEVTPQITTAPDLACRRPIERFGDIVSYPILGGLHHRYARI
jgi:hypothetical protein